MSVRIMAEVWRLDLPANDKIVLLALADHADDEGLCYPSIGRVAWKCCYSRATIKRQMKRLSEAGLVVVVERGGTGKGKTNVLRICPRKGTPLDAFQPSATGPYAIGGQNEPQGDSLGGHQSDSRGSNTASLGVMGEPRTISNHHKPSLVLELGDEDTRKADFNRIWKLCPRGPKGDARIQYMKAVPKRVSHEGLEASWKATIAAASSPQFVPFFHTWIKKDRWSEVVFAGDVEVEVGSAEWFAAEKQRMG